MHKITLRPLRLVRVNTDQLKEYPYLLQQKEAYRPEETSQTHAHALHTESSESVLEPSSSLSGKQLSPARDQSEAEAAHLLQRTPNSYLFNQFYGLWFFVSLFLLTVIITRNVSTEAYGVYAIASAAFNTIAYIVALGLEDAITTYVPRLYAEHGSATASQLIRRLLAIRLGLLTGSMLILLFGIPPLAELIALTHIPGSAELADSMRDPQLLAHSVPIAFYVLGNGISSLFTAVCAALMRMRLVFVIGSITQLLLVGLAWPVLHQGWGIDSILWLLAISSLFNAGAFALWQAPLLFTRGATYRQPLGPVIKLGISAWLTNLANGALLKQVSIFLLGFFAVSVAEIGYFNLSFQLAHSANLLLVAGFGGVSSSALAAAFVGHNYDRLARSWQALIKIETLLAAPLLIFCLFNATNIAHIMYGSRYDAVGPLLAIFLFFNLLVRVLGTTIHQFAMYVLSKPRLVVLSQWIGLLTVVLVGVPLIPLFGPAGALIADGLAQVVTGILMLFFLWHALPRHYPLSFTLRLLLAVTIAALPSLLWHPTDRLLLSVSGVLFVAFCLVTLLWIKPLSREDLEMIGTLHAKARTYLQPFARHSSPSQEQKT